MNNCPSIFEYDNYRIFLQHYYEYQKIVDKSFTYEKFSKKAGIKSLNMLKIIMDGSRDLTIEGIFQFAKALDFSEREQNFFENLVLLDQAKSKEIKNYYLAKLSKIQTNSPPKRVKQELNELMIDWFYPALVLYLDKKNINHDLRPAAKAFNVNIIELQAVVLQLQKEKVLINDNGIFKMESTYFFIKQKNNKKKQQSYIQAQLKQSQKAFEQVCENSTLPSRFFQHSFTLNREDWNKYVDHMRTFLETLTIESNQTEGNTIAQLNMQFFPII